MSNVWETLKHAAHGERQHQYIAEYILTRTQFRGKEKETVDMMSPLLSGKSMFVDLHSHVPNPNISFVFSSVGNWGLDHQLGVEAATLYGEPSNQKEYAKAFGELRKWLHQEEQSDATLLMVEGLQNIGIENMKQFASKDIPAFFARHKKPIALVVTTSHGLSLSEQTGINTFGSTIRMVQANIS